MQEQKLFFFWHKSASASFKWQHTTQAMKTKSFILAFTNPLFLATIAAAIVLVSASNEKARAANLQTEAPIEVAK